MKKVLSEKVYLSRNITVRLQKDRNARTKHKQDINIPVSVTERTLPTVVD